ncbi:K+/H+ antiporter subunit F [Hydrocarboniclastica marina]|uniref:K+/H+ antiporter subunit F n=1 Tax=Hydrocarboniclastica marina TaxID=2259620 RepID=A0A4P7XI74_9ALTE|nr:K+/H+ antiporter subunit F [Hydrocarboniclastica marina]MAL97607.1 K+/H+ antiporter subunit F [Alteromonadaceae bacterium]QCF26698.1 K+/H+ antiporter subunit F [Hydrocarboniclastica marina]
MITWAINIGLALTSLALLLNLYRLVIGPDTPNRILALDTMYINAIATIILLGMKLQSTLLFEAALLIAVMGFVGTVAMSKFLTRGDIIE